MFGNCLLLLLGWKKVQNCQLVKDWHAFQLNAAAFVRVRRFPMAENKKTSEYQFGFQGLLKDLLMSITSKIHYSG